VRAIDLLGQPPDHLGARGVGEPLEFLEVLIDVMTGLRSLARRADQDRALDRGSQGDDVAADRTGDGRRGCTVAGRRWGAIAGWRRYAGVVPASCSSSGIAPHAHKGAS